jgi:hypothetical protein
VNPRIRELAEQAGFIPGIMGLNRFTYFDPEKFAELIVRECMDLLEDYTTDVNVGGIQYNVLSAYETLQKHFGVERD